MAGSYIDMLSFRSNQIILYKRWDGDRSFNQKNCDLVKNFYGTDGNGKKAYSGTITKSSKKRLSNTINIFSQGVKDRYIVNPYIYDPERDRMGKRVKHKFTFLTLTIPDNEKRIEASKGYEYLLEPFLFWLKKTVHCNTYIWKAELQNNIDFTGNKKKSAGQLHYHLIFPNFIDKNLIQNKWNYILQKNGLLNNYYKKTGNYNAPSTRIEKPYKGKNVGDYIQKEITKNCVSSAEIKKLHDLKEIAVINCDKPAIVKLSKQIEKLQQKENESIKGKVWGCSENLQPKKELVLLDEYESKRHRHLKAKALTDANFQKLLYDFEKSRTKNVSNFFELEFTETLERQLVKLSYKYENDQSWKIGEYSNEHCIIWKLPNDYIKDLLSFPVYDNENVSYYDLYNKFLIKRLGRINYRTYLKKSDQLNLFEAISE